MRVCVCMSAWVSCTLVCVSVCVYMSMCCVVHSVDREKKKGKKNSSENNPYLLLLVAQFARHSMKHSRIMGKEKKKKIRKC